MKNLGWLKIYLLKVKKEIVTGVLYNAMCLKVPFNGLRVNLRMRIISVYFRLCATYTRNGRVLRVHGPIRLLKNHDFTVRGIQVESIARGRWMVPLSFL